MRVRGAVVIFISAAGILASECRAGDPFMAGLREHAWQRERASLAAQLDALEFVRWQSMDPWVRADSAWLLEPVPIFPRPTLLWSPIENVRIYDGRGGYASIPARDLQFLRPPLAPRVIRHETASPPEASRSGRYSW